MNRREFLKSTGTAFISIFGITAIACDSKTEDNSGSKLTIESIVSNHDGEFAHNAVNMTVADIEAGTAKDYTLSGGAHQHTFTATAQQMADLKAGTSVVFTTIAGTHQHEMTLKYSK
ncbi:MAG: hypothetical protein KDD94_07425 [Calditrichaeota bacterium]|nr:hypothetical protein [Calditrichota bacterium]